MQTKLQRECGASDDPRRWLIMEQTAAKLHTAIGRRVRFAMCCQTHQAERHSDLFCSSPREQRTKTRTPISAPNADTSRGRKNGEERMRASDRCLFPITSPLSFSHLSIPFFPFSLRLDSPLPLSEKIIECNWFFSLGSRSCLLEGNSNSTVVGHGQAQTGESPIQIQCCIACCSWKLRGVKATAGMQAVAVGRLRDSSSVIFVIVCSVLSSILFNESAALGASMRCLRSRLTPSLIVFCCFLGLLARAAAAATQQSSLALIVLWRALSRLCQRLPLGQPS